MTPILSIAMACLQGLVYSLVAPGVVGFLRWCKARLQGRSGPPVVQPYRDLWKLFHRRPVVPETASWLFRSAPLVVFGASLLPGILAPIFFLEPAPAIRADLLALVYILALVPFLLVLSAFDSGSSFASLGGSRMAFMQFFAEITLLTVVLALAFDQGSTDLNAILGAFRNSGGHLSNDLALWLILAALGLVLLVEAGRLPFDNPNTHLELTMVSRGVLLEYGGPHLALLEWAEAMRLTFFMTLVVNLLLPTLLPSPDWPAGYQALGCAAYGLKLFFLTIGLAVWELSRERLRIRRVAGMAGLAFFFAVAAAFISTLSHLFFFKPF
jgi:formate hydrogenlyase subunit 4